METAKYLQTFVDDMYNNQTGVLQKFEKYPKRSCSLREVLEQPIDSFTLPKEIQLTKELTDFIFWYSTGLEVDSTVERKHEV